MADRETVFHAQGFRGCSVQDITDAAGAPKGSFYNHFKTKEALAVEVLARHRLTSRYEMLEDQSLTPLVRLRRHFEYLIERQATWDFDRGCVAGNFAASISNQTPLMRRDLTEGLERWGARIAQVVREASDAGEIQALHDPDLTGRFLLDAWQGALRRQAVMGSRAPLDEFLKMTFDAILVPPPTGA